MPKPKPVFVPPPSLATCADLIYQTREERLREQGDVREKEEYEKALKAHLVAEMPADQTVVGGKFAVARIENEDVWTVTDWGALYKYIKRKGAFDLLNRALNKAAVDARMEDEKKGIPGIGTFRVTKVSVTKK
jgi:hypothetical protein